MTRSERTYLVLAGLLVLLAVCMVVLLAAIPVGARGVDTPTPLPDACYVPKGGPAGDGPAPLILPTCSPAPRTPWPTATDAPTATGTPNPYPGPAWGSK